MNNAEHIARAYLATWNEVDATRRKALLDQYWTEDAIYTDPLMSGAGSIEIDQLIAGVQQRFPGFIFELKGQPDGHGSHLRFSWTLGPEGVEAPIEGTDYVFVQASRIARVAGFLDKVPAA